jgi:hypothetical protein
VSKGSWFDLASLSRPKIRTWINCDPRCWGPGDLKAQTIPCSCLPVAWITGLSHQSRLVCCASRCSIFAVWLSLCFYRCFIAAGLFSLHHFHCTIGAVSLPLYIYRCVIVAVLFTLHHFHCFIGVVSLSLYL